MNPWFALHVRRNHERPVALALEGKGYGAYLPLYEKLSQWSDRSKNLRLPLFPGYVFGQFEPTRWLPILTIPGVIRIVTVGSTPQPIPDDEIDCVKSLVASGFSVTPWPFLQVGDAVRVNRGSLSGIEGIMVQFKNQYRLVVSIVLLQRSVAVEIDREWVSPASSCSFNTRSPSRSMSEPAAFASS
jgi:transcription antitermination factor NusG